VIEIEKRMGFKINNLHHILLGTGNQRIVRHQRQRLRSASTTALVFPSRPTLHSTYNWRRCLSAATARMWNSLLQLVTSSPPPTTVRRRLETELFIRLYGSDQQGHTLLFLYVFYILIARIISFRYHI